MDPVTLLLNFLRGRKLLIIISVPSPCTEFFLIPRPVRQRDERANPPRRRTLRAGRVHGVETAGEMNWQLLIKMVSWPGFVASRPSTPGALSFPENRQRGLGTVGGWRGTRFSILFVHANYSSWVTLLEIEGARLLFFLFLLERAATLSSSSPWGFPNGPPTTPTPFLRAAPRRLSTLRRSQTSLTHRREREGF